MTGDHRPLRHRLTKVPVAAAADARCGVKRSKMSIAGFSTG
jgi:hypothetical protein